MTPEERQARKRSYLIGTKVEQVVEKEEDLSEDLTEVSYLTSPS